MTVKLTDAQLKQIIREEVEASIDEGVMDSVKQAASGVKQTFVRGKEAASAGVAAAKKSWKGEPSERATLDALMQKCRGNEKEKGDQGACMQIVQKCQATPDGRESRESIFCKACTKDKDPKCQSVPMGTMDWRINDLIAKCKKGNQNACNQCPKEEDDVCRGELPAAAQGEKTAAAGEAPAAAPGEAAKEPAGAAATKNNVYIFKGKGGKGVQSQMARVGIKGQDMSRLMKGLKVDLTAAGFNVMQEAGRRQIALTNTLAALEQIVDPAQKEAVKKILIQVLRSNQVKVHPQHSRALAPSIEDPTPEDTEAAAATKAPDKGEMFNYVSGKGAKAVVVVTDPLERAPEAAQVSKVNPETCKASTSRVFAAPVSKLADPVDRCVPKKGVPKKGQTFNYVSGKGNKSTVVVVDTLDKDPKTVQVAKVNPETCKAASKRVFAVSTAKLTDRAAKCVPKPKQPKAAPEEDRNSWVPKAPGIKEGAGDMKALMENWNKFLE